MTAAHDYEDMHHLVDRLPPAQVRRLRVLVESDPELARFIQPEQNEGPGTPHVPPAQPARRLSIIGIWESDRGDLSERHDEIIRDRVNRSA